MSGRTDEQTTDEQTDEQMDIIVLLTWMGSFKRSIWHVNGTNS